MSKFKFIIILLYLPISIQSQVINAEKFRIRTDSNGWFGEIGIQGSFINSSSKITSAESNLLVEYKRTKDIFIAAAYYSFLKGDDVKYLDEAMLHFRYNIKLNRLFRWEAFTQFQKNEVLHIQTRFLVGTGPRLKIFDTKRIRLYLASLVMFEYEDELSEPNVIHRDFRSSSYISFSIFPFDKTEIVTTNYFQPLLTQIADYRVYCQSSLKIGVAKHFIFSMNLNYAYDQRPPMDILKETSKLTTGITYKI
ncbi:MAG: DUF481 domain-containing protein [Saprospiraceae bacterium]